MSRSGPRSPPSSSADQAPPPFLGVVPEPSDAGPPPWCVVHARPRAEKGIGRFCDRQGLAWYLPLRVREHRYGSRRKWFTSPWFGGYVFVQADAAGQTTLRRCDHVARILPVPDPETLHAVLADLHRALAAGKVREVMPYLEAGQPVRVLEGPLRGVQGILVRAGDAARFAIRVDLIGQAAILDVDPRMLGPAR